MRNLILCINFGSTSSKLALYDGANEVAVKSITHTREELDACPSVNAQLPMRQGYVEQFLLEKKVSVSDLAAIAARAGVTPPVDFGAYTVNECMVRRLLDAPLADHAMNLSAVVAYRLASGRQIPVITYDSCTTDQMEPVYKLSGIPEITRSHMSHVENIRAVSFKAAQKLGRPYEELNLVVVHLGGGISGTETGCFCGALRRESAVVAVHAVDDAPASCPAAPWPNSFAPASSPRKSSSAVWRATAA